MRQEKEIDLYNPDDLESSFDQEPEDTVAEVLDERDYIRPLTEIGEVSLDLSELDISMEANYQDEEEIAISTIENDNHTEISQPENELEISLESDEAQKTDDSSASDAAEDLSAETDGSMADYLDPNEADGDDAPLVEDHPDTHEIDDQGTVEEINQEAEGNSEKITAEKIENSDVSEDKSPLKEIADQPTKVPEAPKSVIRFTLTNKIISFALVVLIITGFVFYHNPALIGLSNLRPPEIPVPFTTIETVAPVEQPVPIPPINSYRDQCLSKIEEAARLRNVLLEKNEEIYELDIHYRNGIAELEEEVHQELKRLGTTSYAKAVKNKHIELNLRTIQRRRAYINGLIKPAFWLNSGSEELFYLIRKAQLDMQLTEIAGGIDLNKHTRHINAAIQKYRPSPDKLAVDPGQSKVLPLEKIWQQVNKKEKVGGYKQKKEQLALNPKDKLIVNQVCSGNFERIAELTNISSRAARCLAQMKGSDLFLNGLVTLSVDAAQQLFQWQGNWICLNGVKNLSPATAQYLFMWKGNWISLNGLNDFPPELAAHLLKWEGQQLELMGLEYKKNETSQKMLKYLALWETTGGKLFVNDKIRQKMDSLM